MTPYNPTLYNARIYWITNPGLRLAAYLDYCDSHPALSPDLAFADLAAPPEQLPPDDQPEDGERIFQRDDIPGWILHRHDDDYGEPEFDDPEPDDSYDDDYDGED